MRRPRRRGCVPPLRRRRDRLQFHRLDRARRRRPRRSPASRGRCRRRPPPLPGPPQAASGHTARRRSRRATTYADAYKPPDAPARRPLPPFTDPYEPLGVRVGSFLREARRSRSTRGYDTNPSHVPNGAALGLHPGRADLKIRSDWSRHEFGVDLRGSYSRLRQAAVARTARCSMPRAVRASTCRATPSSTPKAGIFSRPTIPAARTCRSASPSCRSSRPTAAPSA